MDRDKLVELRQKKNDQKRQEHREILESNESISKSIAKLSESINGMGNYDFNLLNEQLKSLKESSDFGKYIEQIDKSLKEYNEDATIELKNIVDKYGTIQNKALTNAVNLLKNKLKKQTVDQNPENYVPYRRVRKIGDRLVFDDDAMRVTVSGGGGGSFSPYVDENGKITNVQLTPDGKVPTDANISFPTGLAIEAKQDDTITVINTGSNDIVDKLDTLTVTAATGISAVSDKLPQAMVNVPYNEIDFTYPSSTDMLLSYLQDNAVVAEVQITYTDTSMSKVSNIKRLS